jgi:hypothetical protein
MKLQCALREHEARTLIGWSEVLSQTHFSLVLILGMYPYLCGDS